MANLPYNPVYGTPEDSRRGSFQSVNAQHGTSRQDPRFPGQGFRLGDPPTK